MNTLTFGNVELMDLNSVELSEKSDTHNTTSSTFVGSEPSNSLNRNLNLGPLLQDQNIRHELFNVTNNMIPQATMVESQQKNTVSNFNDNNSTLISQESNFNYLQDYFQDTSRDEARTQTGIHWNGKEEDFLEANSFILNEATSNQKILHNVGNNQTFLLAMPFTDEQSIELQDIHLPLNVMDIPFYQMDHKTNMTRNPDQNIRYEMDRNHEVNLDYQTDEISSSSLSLDAYSDLVSFDPLLSSPFILHNIVKYLDLHSILSVSLVCKQMYLAASSDRIWSRYIIKSAKRGRWNWHIAWSGEPNWWIKGGENYVSSDLVNGVDEEEILIKNELIHGYVDYIPCLSNTSKNTILNELGISTIGDGISTVINDIKSVTPTISTLLAHADGDKEFKYCKYELGLRNNFKSDEYTPDMALQYWREEFDNDDTYEADNLALPTIPGRGIKQSYALFKKILHYEVEYRNFQETMKNKSEEISRFVKFRAKPCMWTTLITYFMCVVFWTSITAPMLWDNVIPTNGMWWLIPYAGFGVFVPFFLIVIALEIFFTGWIPCISYCMQYYFQRTCETIRCLLQRSHIAWIHYMSLWFDPWHARDFESRLPSIASLHLLHLPMLIVCIGINQLFFSQKNIMSIVITPTYLCVIGSILDFIRRLIFGKRGRQCHEKFVQAILVFNISLIYIGVVITIAMAASKRDGHAWIKYQSWSIVSIPMDISMAFLIINISFIRVYMIIRDAKYRYHQCMDWLKEIFFMLVIFVTTSLIFIGVVVSIILFPMKLDGTLQIPYTLVVSPIPISIIMVMLCLGVVLCLAFSVTFLGQLFKRESTFERELV